MSITEERRDLTWNLEGGVPLRYPGSKYEVYYQCHRCRGNFELRSSWSAHECLKRRGLQGVVFLDKLLLWEVDGEKGTGGGDCDQLSNASSEEVGVEEDVLGTEQEPSEAGGGDDTESASNICMKTSRVEDNTGAPPENTPPNQNFNTSSQVVCDEDSGEKVNQEEIMGEGKEEDREDNPDKSSHDPANEVETVTEESSSVEVSSLSAPPAVAEATPYKPKYGKPRVSTQHAANETKLDKGVFECLCKKSFTNVGRLTEHVRYFNGDPKFQCRRCPLRFIQLSLLKKHMITAHKDQLPEGTIGCGDCGAIFTEKEEHKAHRLLLHRRTKEDTKEHCVPADASPTSSTFRCTCNRTFARYNYLLAHVRNYTNIHEFRCDVPGCPRVFRSLGRLRGHFRKVHKRKVENDGALGCGICGEMFPNRNRKQLQTHMLQEHGVISWNRPVSDEPSLTHGFGRPSSNPNRQDGTNPQKPRCLCGKRFPTQKALQMHLQYIQRSGSDVRFRCPHCPMEAQFMSHSRLKKHILAVHKVKDYNKFGCNLCGTTWSTRIALRSHQNSVHKLIFEKRPGSQPQ